MLAIQEIYDAYLHTCWANGSCAKDFDTWFAEYMASKEQAFGYQASNNDQIEVFWRIRR